MTSSSQPENRFQFHSSKELPNVTVMQVEMHGFSYGRHAHEEFAIGVTLAGLQEYFSAGTFNRSQPGNIMLFNPEQVHDGEARVDQALQYNMLYIHPEQFRPMLAAAGVEHAQHFRMTETLIHDNMMQRLVMDLSQQLMQPVQQTLHIEHSLYRLAAGIAQRYGVYQPDTRTRRVDHILTIAQDYIHDNLTASLSLDDIANQVHVSKYHFIRLFRRQMGMTPHQYIINTRVNRARHALALGMPIDETASLFGFSDQSHLNRRFKLVYGLTPYQYQCSVKRH